MLWIVISCSLFSKIISKDIVTHPKINFNSYQNLFLEISKIFLQFWRKSPNRKDFCKGFRWAGFLPKGGDKKQRKQGPGKEGTCLQYIHFIKKRMFGLLLLFEFWVGIFCFFKLWNLDSKKENCLKKCVFAGLLCYFHKIWNPLANFHYCHERGIVL